MDKYNRYLCRYKPVAYFFCALIIFGLYGCPGNIPTPMREYGKAPFSGISVKKQVNANMGWQSTKVFLKKGDTLYIDAVGEWSACNNAILCGSAWVSSAEGRWGGASHLYSQWPLSALIGKIGQGQPFLIGVQEVVNVEDEGELLLRMNEGDGWLHDNAGFVTVEIVQDSKHEIIQTNQKTLLGDNLHTKSANVDSHNILIKSASNFAVIIGISDYKDTRIPSLRYASADAKSFYNWATSPDGGRYAPSRVKLLIDQDATGRNIKNALFIWLKQALQEDVVTIYFAGHGSPESPDSPNNLFLLPFDTKYDEIASSGFPMWDIETALKRYIKAKKVVVIADACHSGGVGQSFDAARRASRAVDINPINFGLQNLSQIGDGVCVISASDDKQFSQESKDWGGGHGVFTYFLLEGLKGNADYNKDTNVTLGELIPYLSEQVRRATKNAQSPTVAGKFDPALSIGR